MVDCIDKSDAELAVATLENKEFFACLIERYELALSRYIRRITFVSAEDVEDLLQEVFIRAYVNLHGYDARLQFSSWIYRIAHNVVISEHRKKKARPEGHLVDAPQELFESLVSDIDIEKEIDNEYLGAQLTQAMNALPEKYRAVLILRFLEEKEYEEISDILEVPMGTVATLLHRAKIKMKKEFIRLGFAESYG